MSVRVETNGAFSSTSETNNNKEGFTGVEADVRTLRGSGKGVIAVTVKEGSNNIVKESFLLNPEKERTVSVLYVKNATPNPLQMVTTETSSEIITLIYVEDANEITEIEMAVSGNLTTGALCNAESSLTIFADKHLTQYSTLTKLYPTYNQLETAWGIAAGNIADGSVKLDAAGKGHLSVKLD